jgi:hypothetical protein
MQHLLSGAVWDADAVRDDVRDYVIEHLGDPAAVAVGDERLAGDPPAVVCSGRPVHRDAPAADRATHPGHAAGARVPPERWLRRNAGDGAKGRRWYA